MKLLENGKKLLLTIGIKPAESNSHEVLRIIVLLVVLGVACYIIYSEAEEIEEMDEMDEMEEIKEIAGQESTLYKSIIQMDKKSRKKCLKILKNSLKKEPSALTKYIQAILAALCVGITSEYIISGNIKKPFGSISKTTVSALITAVVSG